MKVKISYNIELDDVPSHVSELLDNVSDRLKQTAQSTTNTAIKVKSNTFSASTLVATLGSLREELEKIDTLLADFGAILMGYEQAKISPDVLMAQQEADEQQEISDEQ
jgi:hypothetical protein